MTYREFRQWCEKRARDGCWGVLEALTCCDIVSKMQLLPFWLRERVWRKSEAREVAQEIVEATNRKIKKVLGGAACRD